MKYLIHTIASGSSSRVANLFEALQKLVTSPQCLGCPFLNAAAEFPAHEHPGHQAALANKRRLRERLRELARAAGARDPHATGDALMLLMEGSFLSARTFGAIGPAVNVAQAAASLLH